MRKISRIIPQSIFIFSLLRTFKLYFFDQNTQITLDNIFYQLKLRILLYSRQNKYKATLQCGNIFGVYRNHSIYYSFSLRTHRNIIYYLLLSMAIFNHNKYIDVQSIILISTIFQIRIFMFSN